MAAALDVPYRMSVRPQPNRGLAAARNRGAEEAAHPVVVFLDDDIRPAPGFLSAHATAHAEGREPRLLLGAYPPADVGDDLLALVVRAWWHDHFRALAEPGHRWTFADVCDGNASLPVELFRRLGRFDEAFTGGRRQDWEFGLRVLRAGVPIRYSARARGDHHFDTAVGTFLRNARQEARYDVVLGRKHPAARHLLPLAMLDADGWSAYTRRGVRRASRALAHPGVAERVLARLEALELRGRWWRLLTFLWRVQYARGLADALPRRDERTSFLTLSPRPPEEAAVPLEGAAAPAAMPALASHLRLEDRGLALAAVPVVAPGGQWELENLLDRVTAEVEPAAALAALLER